MSVRELNAMVEAVNAEAVVAKPSELCLVTLMHSLPQMMSSQNHFRCILTQPFLLPVPMPKSAFSYFSFFYSYTLPPYKITLLMQNLYIHFISKNALRPKNLNTTIIIYAFSHVNQTRKKVTQNEKKVTKNAFDYCSYIQCNKHCFSSLLLYDFLFL